MAIIKIKNPAIDLDAAEIPNLDANKITTGTIDNARISLDANEIPSLDTAKITTGTFDDARMPSTVLNSNVSVPNQSAFKNIIINGDMSIAQRGTSSSITTSGYYTVDRFNMPINTMGTFTVSQSTDTPTGQGFSTSSKYDCTTADASPASGDFIRFEQYVEAQNLQYLKFGTANAQSLTLSFWVKSTKTGTYIAELRNFDGGRTICNSYTINASNTWEKKTITVSGDTSGSFNNDNGLGLACTFWLGAGSDFTSGTLATDWEATTSANRAVGQVNLADSTSNEWYITGVQLEAGTTASDFEFLPYDVNLQRCQRYYELCDGNRVVGTSYNSKLFCNQIRFSVTKRVSPTITIQNNTTVFTVFHSGGYDTSQTWNTDEQDIDYFNINMTNTRATGFIGPGDDLFIANSEI